MHSIQSHSFIHIHLLYQSSYIYIYVTSQNISSKMHLSFKVQPQTEDTLPVLLAVVLSLLPGVTLSIFDVDTADLA